MKRYAFAGLVVTSVLAFAAAVQGTLYTDNFNRADELLALGPDWTARGDKNQFEINSNMITADNPNPDGQNGNWYIGAVQTVENYQRASIEFRFGLGTPNYQPTIDLKLNQNQLTSGYFLADNGYRLRLRGHTDFAIFKNVGGTDVIATPPGPGHTDPFTSFTGGNLLDDTWYRATIIRSNDVISASITSLDGLTTFGANSITDTGTLLNGGRAGLAANYDVSGVVVSFDNWEFELFNIVPEPSSVGLLGLGSLLVLLRRKK